jgi:hypothetical protein
MGLDRRETGWLLFDGCAMVPEGKVPLVREEQGIVATSLPVVRPGRLGSHAAVDKG